MLLRGSWCGWVSGKEGGVQNVSDGPRVWAVGCRASLMGLWGRGTVEDLGTGLGVWSISDGFWEQAGGQQRLS